MITDVGQYFGLLNWSALQSSTWLAAMSLSAQRGVEAMFRAGVVDALGTARLLQQ